MNASAPLLRVDQVSKSLGGRDVLSEISFSVEQGEVLAIVGPSGAGKSTLLQCINHLLTVDSGRVLLRDQLVGYTEKHGHLYEKRGRALAHDRAHFGFVFQQFNLFPHLTAAENVAEGVRVASGSSRRAALQEAADWLDQVGLAHERDAYPSRLSGGQQQRVGIARALAARPDVLLLDEPTSALDPELVESVLEVIQRVAQTGMTMVLVTHELGFAREASDHTLVLEAGRVVEIGPSKRIFEAPESPRTRTYLRSVLRDTSTATQETGREPTS